MPDPAVDNRYFASVNSQASITVQIYYYSDTALKISQIIPALCYGSMAIGFVGAVLGLFAKRLAGLESIITCQMALVSIMWINTCLLKPFSQAFPLQYVLGFHKKLTTSGSNSTLRLLVSRISTDPPYTV